MHYKLVLGLGFIGAGLVVVIVSQYMNISQIFRFPIT